MEQKISLEKKLELARTLRRENMENRMKVRQREGFLYGSGYVVPPCEERLQEDEYAMGALMGKKQAGAPDGANHFLTGFKCRMILSLVLFAVFLLYDAGGSEIGGCSAEKIHEMIAEDPFLLCGEAGAEVADEIAALLDFDK